MKKKFVILLCLLLSTSCAIKEKKQEELQQSTPTATMISATANPRVNVIPLYVPQIPFTSSWSIITTDGNCVQNATYNKQNLDILFPGANLEAISLYREGIPFTKGGKYKLSFDVDSSVSRKIYVYAQSETGEKIFEQTLDIGNHSSFSFDIPMNLETTWNGKIGFNIGFDGSEQVKTQHQINISNLMLRASDVDTRVIKVDQVGYLPVSQKKFIAPYNVGDFYNVVDTKTNNVVFSGVIGGKKENEGTKETNFYGDFGELTTPGTYRVETQIVATSYEFTIEPSIYDGLLTDALRMLSLQRCGDKLDKSFAGGFSRENCHSSDAIVYGTQDKINVSGGWHDAGDYGRYVKTGAKGVADLLLAYKINPQYFSDKMNIKESNNGMADILDEAKYELSWMLKMQTASGGVYKSVVSDKFAGYQAPEDDHSTLYVLPISTNATGSFAGVMGLSYVVFKDVDKDFANKCLEASKKAYEYLSLNTTMSDPLNPEGFDAGEYRDDSDLDERFYASMSLWNATGEQKYLDNAKELVAKDERVLLGLNWQTVGTYGEYLYLSNKDAKNDHDFYTKLYNHFMAQADNMLGFSNNDGYFLTLSNNYNWGSNMDVSNNGMLLMLADNITPNDNYVDRAFDQLHYLLGRNSLNTSFVTGYGNSYPKNIHNRMVMAKKLELVGAMVGGPNRNLEDAIVKEKFNETNPPAKIYIDNNMSYSTNEVAVYWNSSVVFLISSLKR